MTFFWIVIPYISEKFLKLRAFLQRIFRGIGIFVKYGSFTILLSQQYSWAPAVSWPIGSTTIWRNRVGRIWNAASLLR